MEENGWHKPHLFSALFHLFFEIFIRLKKTFKEYRKKKS